MVWNKLYHTIGIYGVRNLVDDGIYIGKTSMNFGDRRDCHFALLRYNNHCNKNLQNAWNEYGENNFEFIILQECDNANDLNQLEIEYIRSYREVGLVYNIDDGGDSGGLGKHLSDETKQKIGEKNRINGLGRKASEETRKKMSVAQSGKKQTEETKALLSKKLTGKVRTDEVKERLRIINEENPPSAKYSADTIREIRRLHEVDGMGYTEIAKIMPIPRGVIYEIATYRRWKHLI